MPDSFTFRWAILSDYAGQDESGKIVIAGGYTEDLVFQTAPKEMPEVTMTICIAPKVPEFRLEMVLARASGEALFRATGTMIADGETGPRDRATFRMPFPKVKFPGEGVYQILLGDNPESLEPVHEFAMIVSPEE